MSAADPFGNRMLFRIAALPAPTQLRDSTDETAQLWLRRAAAGRSPEALDETALLPADPRKATAA